MGFYSFQIRLYDSAEMKSRVTIPPVMNGFDIRNPIAAEDETNVVDQGIVDYARIFKDQSNEELPTFDWTGAYNKTEWVHHDVITENKMNKIEDALYSINANIKESDVVMLNALDNVKKDADKYVKEHMAEVEQDVEEFERNLNTDVQQFKIDTNAAMTAHKNEVSEEIEGFSTQLADNENSINSVNTKLKGFYNLHDFSDKVIDGDWSLAINYALSVCDKLYIPKGTYICKTKINIRQNKCVEGDGQYNTTLSFSNLNDDCAIEVMYKSFGSSQIKNLFILSDNSTCNGVVLTENTENNRTVFGFFMDSVSVRGFKQNIRFDSLSTYTTFNRVYSDTATEYNLYVVSGFANIFTNCRFSSSKKDGVYCRAGEQNFINCSFEGNYSKGLYISPNGGKISLDSCFFEMLDSSKNSTLLHVDSPSGSFNPLSLLNINNCHFYNGTNSMYLVGVENARITGNSILNSFSNKEIAFSSSNSFAKDWYFKGNKITNEINKQPFFSGDYGFNVVEKIDFSNIPKASEEMEGRFIYTINDGISELRCCMRYSNGTYGWKPVIVTS